jgi:Mce-associated membrane protein
VTADRDEESTTGGAGGRSGGLRTAMAAVLVLLLVVALGLGVWGYTRLSSVESQLDARSDVVRVAESFMVQFNTYDPENVDRYVDSVNELLSTSAKATFGKELEDITTLIRETELESEGTVHASGVASLDDDSARVLVVADAEAASEAGPVQRHFRWEISLVQVDGEWLVDDFEPVA